VIFVSPDLLKEYREVPAVLLKRGKIDNRQFMALIAGIAAVVAKARLVHPKKRLETGDLDLLSIRGLPFTVEIVTPADYLATKNRKR